MVRVVCLVMIAGALAAAPGPSRAEEPAPTVARLERALQLLQPDLGLSRELGLAQPLGDGTTAVLWAGRTRAARGAAWTGRLAVVAEADDGPAGRLSIRARLAATVTAPDQVYWMAAGAMPPGVGAPAGFVLRTASSYPDRDADGFVILARRGGAWSAVTGPEVRPLLDRHLVAQGQVSAAAEDGHPATFNGRPLLLRDYAEGGYQIGSGPDGGLRIALLVTLAGGDDRWLMRHRRAVLMLRWAGGGLETDPAWNHGRPVLTPHVASVGLPELRRIASGGFARAVDWHQDPAGAALRGEDAAACPRQQRSWQAAHLRIDAAHAVAAYCHD